MSDDLVSGKQSCRKQNVVYLFVSTKKDIQSDNKYTTKVKMKTGRKQEEGLGTKPNTETKYSISKYSVREF